jgi:hypothetical protein
VHIGTAAAIQDRRQAVLNAACAADGARVNLPRVAH